MSNVPAWANHEYIAMNIETLLKVNQQRKISRSRLCDVNLILSSRDAVEMSFFQEHQASKLN